MPELTLAAVLGDPIGHSLSPRMHNHWFAAHSLPGSYSAIQCPGEASTLLSILQDLRAQGYAGCNLTVPLKEIVLTQSLSNTLQLETEPSARKAGAANTLIFADGITRAVNTDIDGVQYSLNQLQMESGRAIRNVLILGAGGAARGALVALQDLDCDVSISNRTPSRAEAAAGLTGATVLPWHARTIADAMAESDCIIQTTSLELLQPDMMSILQPKLSLQNTMCFDMVYRKGHAHSQWSAWAESSGATSTDGLPMLVAQGAYAFQRWTGILPDIEATIPWMRQ